MTIPTRSPSLAWERRLGIGCDAPLAAGDRFIFASVSDRRQAELLAVDRSSGDRAWSVPITNPALLGDACPLLADGQLYITDRYVVLRIDAATGRILARTRVPGRGGVTAPPAVRDGSIYVCTAADTVYAFDADSLEPTWVFDIGHGPPYARPVVADGRVYLAAGGATGLPSENELICLDAATGEPVWRTEAGRSDELFCHPPAIWRDRLILPTDRYARSVVALECADGSVLWERDLGDDRPWLPVTDDPRGAEDR